MAEVEKMTVEKAAEFLGQGFHCSQCVIGYGADKLGLDKDLMLQVSGGLGGGCFHGDVCGAVSGAIMAISAKYGYQTPEGAKANNAKMVEKLQEFETKFKERYGTIVCRELLGGYSFSNPEHAQKIMTEGLTKNCPGYCAGACEILDEILKDEE